MGQRLIAVTDRISAFDSVLDSFIPAKGAVLNKITNFWFKETSHIIDNHFIAEVDPDITLVQEVVPIKVEMVIRGYLTGSMWRYYSEGKRTFSGLQVPDGLTKNQKFPTPILTPTTKEDSDREITPEDIIASGLTDAKTLKTMMDAARALYDFGSTYLAKKGIILVDTKYEFGIKDGKVILIDEIHTPDSSRFWKAENYAQSPENAEQIDKEFVRQWLIANKKDGKYPTSLPAEVVAETTKRYIEIYEAVTGETWTLDLKADITNRVYANLVRHNIIKSGYVAIVMGSISDEEHARKIKGYLKPYPVKVELRVVSAHKNGEDIAALADEYNSSIERGVVIAVAGRSNGLGGALAANLNIPVINCPPFKDNLDLMVNINSSLMMPGNTPALTVVHPDNAAMAALRCLNLNAIRSEISTGISKQKKDLREADKKMKSVQE
jgi:phosphoribosylaminoimidazole-succinocarboxamide synthase